MHSGVQRVLHYKHVKSIPHLARTPPVPIRSLGAAVRHNFRRTLLVPSREENISSLGTAVQHNYRRTLLVTSREEKYQWTERRGTT